MTFEYSRIVIVAHSLGSIVVRRALLGAEDEMWMNKTRLVLFAPAHKGAFIAKLVFAALTGVSFSAAVVSVAKFVCSSVEGLEKGSDELKKLEEDTLSAISKRGTRGLEPLKAAKVLIGEFDRIVIQDDFAQDQPADPVPGHGHMDVCKPTPTFRLPIQVIESVL